MSGRTPLAGRSARLHARATGIVPGRRLHIGPLHSLWYPRSVITVCLMGLLCLALAIHLVTTGSYQLGPVQVFDALRHPDGGTAATIVWDLRLPRIATAVVTGACLGVSGLLFQSLSRNALGSPEILGLVSGAALGAVVGITLLHTTGWGTSLAAVAGCAGAALVAELLSRGTTAGTSRLVLMGIGLSALWSSLSSLLLTRTDPDVAVGGQMWLTGSLNARLWEHALVPAVALIVALPAAVLASRQLAALDLGTDMGAQLGLRVDQLGRRVGLLGIVLTGAAIASTGPISFVSLVAPHIACRLVRRPGVPVVSSAVTGAALLLAAEWAAHRLPEAEQVPVGIATSVLGGVYLVVIVLRRSW